MAEIEGFEWITVEQESMLVAAFGDSTWPQELRLRLDEIWPEWQRADETARQEWLTTDLDDTRRTGTAEVTDVTDLAWLTEAQRSELARYESAYGSVGQWLPVRLDEWWPTWRAAQPDTLADYLDQCLPTLTAEAAPQVEPDVRDLSWLTPEHHEQLTTLAATRGDWRKWLPEQLTAWWEQWPSATPEELVPWLDGWLPTLVADQAGAAAAETVPDPRALGWVTPQIAAGLDELTEIRGDWRTWLPAELDQRVPGWESMDTTALVQQVDTLVGILVVPADAVDLFVDEVLLPALAVLPEVAELSDEDLAEILDELISEQLAVATDA